MWTPRRILLLLLGLAGFVATYLAYAALLGGIDGLPELPAEYVTPPDTAVTLPPLDPVSPTVRQLEKAFGPNSQEVQDTLAYKTKLELRDKGIVIASGQPFPDGTPFVSVSPFSVAFFGKPRPAHLRQPDEADEISTFHADRAVLQFDKPVGSVQDLANGKANLVSMELLAAPEIPSFDPRRGQIEITNNQRSRDPRQHLVFRTTGPLFYKSPEAAAQSPNAPQVWTSAAVEVVDRKNLPRPLGSTSVATSPVRADELRNRSAVADVLLGTTLPPPTITAEGMKLYLEAQDKNTPATKRNGTGYTGVKRIEMDRKVQMNLWTDGGGGFPGSTAPVDPAATARKAVLLDPPAATAAVAGGFADGVAVAHRLEDRTLLVIQTPGSFRYDFDAGRAWFESAPAASEAVANHVTVFRTSALGRQDDLSCAELVIDFADPPSQQPNAPPKAAPAGREGMKIKSLTATGPYVYVSVESEQLLAQGTALHYTTDPKTRRTVTTLKGNPVNAIKDRNHLVAGAAATPAEVVITSLDPDPAANSQKKQTALSVNGPGVIKLYDQQTNDATLRATWGKSLTQEKELVGKEEQDLLKFEGGGSFEDLKGGMKLTADRLWLWLAPNGEKPAEPKATASGSNNARPQRLWALGKVESQSADLIIGIPGQPAVDQLTVWFRDVPPPTPPQTVAETTPPPKPLAPTGPPVGAQTTPTGQPSTAPPPAAPTPARGGQPPVVAQAQPNPKDPPKEVPKEEPKKPILLSARVIESWVIRYPAPAAEPKGKAKAPPGKADSPGLKYEMERARCEDRVVAHQDPTDPAKNPRGLDIKGDKLFLDQSKAGSVLEVTALPYGQVHFEGTSIWGPVIKIDQPANTVAVKGRGVLEMPSQSDTAGGNPEKPSLLRVYWAREMLFEGAKARAEFVEAVQALQLPAPESPRSAPEPAPAPRTQPIAHRQPAAAPPPPAKPDDDTWSRSQVACHELKVTFDRPVYFNNFKRSGSKTKPDKDKKADSENPRLKTAQCTPMPQDEADKLPPQNASLARLVIYLDETFDKAGNRIKAQRIVTRQLDLRTDEEKKGQVILAYGGGEVRILQPGPKDEFGKPAQPRPPTPKAGEKAKEEEQPLKLTLVRFTARMFAKDTNKVYQEATFDDGARVWYVPTDNLDLKVTDHAAPPGSMFLSCTETLKVSSARLKPGDPPDQRLTAVGNGEFEDEEHKGYAHTITYAGDAVTLDGHRDRDAKLYGKTGVNKRDFYIARQIVYYKDGRVHAPGSTGGAFTPP